MESGSSLNILEMQFFEHHTAQKLIDRQHRAAKSPQIHVAYLNVIAVQALPYYEGCVID